MEPVQRTKSEPRQNDRELDIEHPDAIKSTKIGKTAGHDNIVEELLKTDLKERINKGVDRVLQQREGRWHTTKLRSDKLPKKGGPRECKNWKGIALSQVISRNFGRALISRIQKGVDTIQMKKKAGF